MKIIAPIDLTSGRVMLIAEINVRAVLGNVNKFTVANVMWVSNMTWLKRIWDTKPDSVILDLENDYYSDDNIFNEHQIINKVFSEFKL